MLFGDVEVADILHRGFCDRWRGDAREALRTGAGCRLRVTKDKTHSEQNESAFPPKTPRQTGHCGSAAKGQTWKYLNPRSWFAFPPAPDTGFSLPQADMAMQARKHRSEQLLSQLNRHVSGPQVCFAAMQRRQVAGAKVVARAECLRRKIRRCRAFNNHSYPRGPSADPQRHSAIELTREEMRSGRGILPSLKGLPGQTHCE